MKSLPVLVFLLAGAVAAGPTLDQRLAALRAKHGRPGADPMAEGVDAEDAGFLTDLRARMAERGIELEGRWVRLDELAPNDRVLLANQAARVTSVAEGLPLVSYAGLNEYGYPVRLREVPAKAKLGFLREVGGQRFAFRFAPGAEAVARADRGEVPEKYVGVEKAMAEFIRGEKAAREEAWTGQHERMHDQQKRAARQQQKQRQLEQISGYWQDRPRGAGDGAPTAGSRGAPRESGNPLDVPLGTLVPPASSK